MDKSSNITPDSCFTAACRRTDNSLSGLKSSQTESVQVFILFLGNWSQACAFMSGSSLFGAVSVSFIGGSWTPLPAWLQHAGHQWGPGSCTAAEMALRWHLQVWQAAHVAPWSQPPCRAAAWCEPTSLSVGLRRDLKWPHRLGKEYGFFLSCSDPAEFSPFRAFEKSSCSC